MNNIVDAQEVLELFADLNSRQQKQVYRNALRRAANILVKASDNCFASDSDMFALPAN